MAGEADNAFCAVRPPGHHAEPRPGDGVLPVQQRRDRRLAGARGARARRASRSSISTCITATARRRASATTRACSTPRRTSTRSIPAPARRARPGSATSSTCRCAPMAGSREFRARLQPRDPAGARRVPARAGADLGRVRRPQKRPARATFARRSRLRLGNRAAAGGRRQSRQGRVVSTLEGGYDLAALGASAAAHVRVLMSAWLIPASCCNFATRRGIRALRYRERTPHPPFHCVE